MEESVLLAALPPPIICWRYTLHRARKLLSVKCAYCGTDIDTGQMYFSWAGLVIGSFYWYYVCDSCV